MGNDGEGISDKSGLLTPRQEKFLKNWLDPKSETYSNAYRSALKAGYGEAEASNITCSDLKWLRDSYGDSKMVEKAEKNLEKAMEIPIDDEKIGQRNLEASKFVAGRLGKNKWSEKTEVKHSGEIDIKKIDLPDLDKLSEEELKKLEIDIMNKLKV